MHKSEMRYSPIAIFLYNRPDRALRLFQCLAESALFLESQVHIFIDGPKSIDEKENVEMVKRVAEDVDHPSLYIHISEENRGLKASIVAGVTSVCEEHDNVIVLEDDLELSPVTLEYFNLAIEKYRNVPSIYSVSGYLPGPGFQDDLDRAVLLPYAHSWGWATWSRAWEGFEIDPESTKSFLSSRVFRRLFNLGGLRNYSEMLELANRGAIDSWYIYWLFYIFRNRGVSVFPCKSYVKNLGSAGTHSSSYNPLHHLLSHKSLNGKLVELPDLIDIDYWALDSLRNTTEARVQRLSGWIGSKRRKLLPAGR